jgi:hypothetical protein
LGRLIPGQARFSQLAPNQFLGSFIPWPWRWRRHVPTNVELSSNPEIYVPRSHSRENPISIGLASVCKQISWLIPPMQVNLDAHLFTAENGCV